MQPIGRLPPQDWLSAPAVRKVMHALTCCGSDAKFVGGCVRDTLLSRPVHDVDIAATDLPEKVITLLTQARIKTVPLGLTHGSVLAVQGDMTFHITTLRTDLETYGRRAKVGFIESWQEDAKRRDFTMNALYADLDGAFYDPCQGLPDLQAGRVVFIGDPAGRIHEDYLRILRFFRFQAYYGRGMPDAKAVEACARHQSGLKNLSGERIWGELNRLLIAENPMPCLEIIRSQGIWPTLFEGLSLAEGALAGLKRLIELETKLELSSHPLRRFAALIEIENLPFFAKRLRLSLSEKNRLKTLLEIINTQPDLTILKNRNRLLYGKGVEIFQDVCLILAVKSREDLNIIQGYIREAASWRPHILPVKGGDLMKLGVPAGSKLGKTLKALEDWWIDNSFQPTHEDCLAWARAFVAAQLDGA